MPDDDQRTLAKRFPSDSYLGDQKHVDRIIDWATYYRRNIHRFATHYLGIKLHPYQIFLLYKMSQSTVSCVVAARAAAKSWLVAVYACCVAILWPGSQIVIAAKTKGQSKLIISQKISKELMGHSENLRREIENVNDNLNNVEVDFRNGSKIEVRVAGENTRGVRSNVLICDEFRQINKKDIDSVLVPTGFVRQPPYRMTPQYEHLMEEAQQIYISSAYNKCAFTRKRVSNNSMNCWKPLRVLQATA
jgi:hypothetical protein